MSLLDRQRAEGKPERNERARRERNAAIIGKASNRASINREPIGPCFTCGHSIVLSSGRFCSERCRERLDAGAPRYEPPPNLREILERFPASAKILSQGPHGAYILCAGCNQRFESRGWRHCSRDCRDRARNRQAIIATGIEFDDRRRRCEAPGCERRIPLFRNGRAVSKAKRFCSPQCRNAARKSVESPLGAKTRFSVQFDKKTPDFIDPNSGAPKSFDRQRGRR